MTTREPTVDRFTMDVLRESFSAVADEMFVSLQRTSQSPVIYEVLDFAVGLTDANGELVSQGNGIAGFLGPLGEVARETIVRYPDLAPGDVSLDQRPVQRRREPSLGCGDGPPGVRWRSDHGLRCREGPLDRGRGQGPRFVDRRLGRDLPGRPADAIRPRVPRRSTRRESRRGSSGPTAGSPT